METLVGVILGFILQQIIFAVWGEKLFKALDYCESYYFYFIKERNNPKYEINRRLFKQEKD